VVEGDGTPSEEDQAESECRQGEGEFIPPVTEQSVVEVHRGDGDGQIDADGKSGYPREQPQQNEQAAKELAERREVAGPSRQSEAGDELGMVVESAENLLGSMADHDCAEG